MKIIKITGKRLTKDDAAKALGLQTYDTALPQPWLDDLFRKLTPYKNNMPENWKEIVTSGLVWCYRGADGVSSLMGYPVVLTVQVMNFLTIRELPDFDQPAIIETRETYVISGSQPVRDTVVAEDPEQAEMIFRFTYPGVLINSIQTKEAFNG